MKQYNPAEELIDSKTPFDSLVEKEESEIVANPYRENALAFTRIISLALGFIVTSQDKTLGTLAVIYSLGLTDLVEGRSMRDMARELGYSSGTISLNAKRFRQLAGIPPSLSQQDEQRVETARITRIKKLQ